VEIISLAFFLPFLQEYGIVQKLRAIIGSHPSTNDTLCRAVEAYLKREDRDSH
jgi:hypothetical protein